ncbi:phosphatidylinositol 3,4,5-trisphosphate 5-phosphatase 2A-like isoform X2 [Dreissena polymorpha]|nr:phosphatidylinositol 3,4,5-trisphosphate 5-phosphatase 2A-like isoform X2 [Dreissena polymorpha]XP_052218775.1 phosphatidylinositol 3,4,5-trisphosphate 5-phosphatase 2A-like isoform X2 [Dreissena polymorpha]XP_052218776.1 phosphatidylinositol 3,4,5-trisphosphate 5-phosphatase 2A-like isoform X2 [Dreissena polymorpha]XP_052218777.1 phosphatidylinositol 3,4,5-trisphosphate 5-phosphatase 2A-like isoform X2 [Dreissena polymorpha]
MSVAFFHKGITRFQAEVLLTQAKDDGSFLVRDSESLSGAYVLCVLMQSKVHQYRVLPGPDCKLHVQSEGGTIQRGYNDLTELIADYIKKKENNGLICALVHPVPPDGSSEDVTLSDDEDDEEDEEDEDEDFVEMPPLRSPPPGQKERKSNGHADHDKLDLQKRFTQLDLSQCEAKFKQALKDYIDHGVSKDSASLNAGDSELHEFTKLLESTADGLRRELDKFMRNIDTLHELLRVGDRKHSTLDSKQKLTGSGLPSLLEQMSRVRTKVLNIQTEAQETIQLTTIPSEYEFLDCHVSEKEFVAGIVAGPFLKSKYRPYIPQSKFEVKKIKHGGKAMSKITLNVDLQTGKYSVLKLAGKENLVHSSFDHDRILHLIKSTKHKCNLDVILDGKKKQTYSFADPHARENFCLQIRQMKNMHSTEAEIDQISLFVGTWNMGDASINQSLSTWLKCTGSGASRDRVLGVIPHDVYVVGTQESSTTEKDWVSQLKAGLKACVLVDMELVEVCSLWGIRLAILCKPEHKAHITRVQRSSVRTGIANALGNKGAVAISFYFNGTSFCFINTHLTSGDERCNRRNQNFRDIVKNLTLNLGQKHLSLFDITSQFQHVFWLGDLNYRIEEDIKMILRKVHEKDIGFLMERDQLRKQQKHKTAFSGFQEAEVTFLPTYRLERNVPGNKYAWKKVKTTGVRINAPSYCDRVLWKSYPGTFVENVAYGCSDAILSSDHRPVFSSFNVGISSEFIQTRQSLSEMAPVTIVFNTVEAQVKTCCKQYFQLTFHSSCLPDMFRSQSNTSFKENKIGFFTVPVWLKNNLPEMRPIFADQSYLEDQHILIAVIAKDADNESYGECVVSLRGMFSEEPKDFECLLHHQGEEVGKISGKFHVRSVGKQTNTRTMHRNYSLIAFDTEYQYQDPEMFVSDHPMHRSSAPPQTQKKPGPSSVQPAHGFKSRAALRQTVSDTMDSRSTDPHRDMARSLVDQRHIHAHPGSGVEGQPPPLVRRNTPLMGHGGLSAGAQRPLRQTSAPGGQKFGPPLPPKHRTASVDQHPGARHDGRHAPTTLDEWLAGLNLSCYTDKFLLNGWDSLLYLTELKQEDLRNIGIDVPEHQKVILSSVKDLNQSPDVSTYCNRHYENTHEQEPGVDIGTCGRLLTNASDIGDVLHGGVIGQFSPSHFDEGDDITEENEYAEPEENEYHVPELIIKHPDIVDSQFGSLNPETKNVYNVLGDHELEIIKQRHEIYESYAPKHVYSCLEDKGFEEAYTTRRISDPIVQSCEKKTLGEWLDALSLGFYLRTLEDNGWVNLLVLRELTESDLDNMNIRDRKHKNKILTAINHLKSNN